MCPCRSDHLEVDTIRAGTASYHVGSPPDSRSLRTCAKYGIQTSHRARQITDDDLQTFDYVLAMDNSNLEDIQEIVSSIEKKEDTKLGKGTGQYALR